MRPLPPDILQRHAPLPHGPTGPGCAMALVQGGDVVAQCCTGMASIEHQVAITPQTVFRIASITKQFLCAGLVALADEAKLDLDAPLRDFVRLCPGPAKATIRQAMSNTSGIRDHIELFYMAGGGLQVPHRIGASLDLIARQKETNFPPGARFLYSNANFLLLSRVAEIASGQPLPAYLKDRFFDPLGMTRTRLRGNHFDVVPDLATGYVVDPDGNLKRGRMTMELSGDGAAMSCLEDLVTWTRFYRDDPDGLIARMRQPVPVGQGHAPYGLGLFSETVLGRPSLVHTGLWPGYLTEVLYLLDDDLALITLANVNSIEPTRVNRNVIQTVFSQQLPGTDLDVPGWTAAQDGALWLDPETLDVAEFSELEGHRLLSTYGFSSRLQTRPDGQLQPEFLRSDILKVDVSAAADHRIALTLANSRTLDLVPAATLRHDVEIKDFLGEWSCPEIDGRLIIRGTPEHLEVETPGFRGHDWIARALPGGIVRIEEMTGPWPRQFFLFLQKDGRELVVNGPRVRRLCYQRSTGERLSADRQIIPPRG